VKLVAGEARGWRATRFVDFAHPLFQEPVEDAMSNFWTAK